MKSRPALFATFCCLHFSTAHAEKLGGPYFAVGGGQSTTSAFGGEFKENSPSYKGIFGYQFGDYIAVEAAYFNADDHSMTEDTLTVAAGITGYNASLLLRAPKGGSFAFFLKAGYASYEWELSATLPGIAVPLGTVEDDDVSYGAGINYVLRNGLLLRLEYEGIAMGNFTFRAAPAATLNVGDVDFTVVTLAVGYKF
jgi:hypothetical protein